MQTCICGFSATFKTQLQMLHLKHLYIGLNWSTRGFTISSDNLCLCQKDVISSAQHDLAKWDNMQIHHTALPLTICAESLPFSSVIGFSRFPHRVSTLWRDFIFKSKLSSPNMNIIFCLNCSETKYLILRKVKKIIEWR